MNSTELAEKRLDTQALVERGLRRRYRAEWRFRAYGIFAIFIASAFLFILLGTVINSALPAFQRTVIQLQVTFDEEKLEVHNIHDPAELRAGDFDAIIKSALRDRFPNVSGRAEKRELYQLASIGAVYKVQEMLMQDSSLLNKSKKIWFYADDTVDDYYKTKSDSVNTDLLSLNKQQWLNDLQQRDELATQFNGLFLTAGDSRDPELAGIRSALMGSFYTLLITLVLSFPLGVMAAIYLEEFAPTNRWTDVIEVNINNLAAVPSIVFGLLGLAVFINFFGMPRRAPVVGGFVLALMTLPTVIIASRAAIQLVPPSIREAALGIGASQMQTVLHHVLPLAMPGMMTGTIIGMARALGESAPLLMIGMVAFVVEVPQGFLDPSTALPVQIYLWADSPERSYTELTAAAIVVLLVFLITMNLLAVLLRKKFERRW